tara:strand:+ start:899 stop:1561 length:663 start_codon:yes stop_codon:yes gene_type:complete
MTDITFTALDMGISDEDRQTIYNEVMSAPEEKWHFNEFRGCYMLPVFNAGGQLGGQEKGKDTKNGEFIYTEPAQNWKFTQNLLQEKVFPWMEPMGRVTILRTPAGYGLNVHLDSSANEIGTLQHKFRIVLNGNVDKLYFIDKHHNEIYIPDDYYTYVLDGSHPHALKPGTEEKVTLCIGAPWHGSHNKKYLEILENSLYTMKVSRPDSLEEEWTDPFWKK